MRSRFFGGLGLILVLSLFISTSAFANPSFGPQPWDINKYYYFGDETYPSNSRQGLDLTLDPSSVSYQSVKATLTMDYNIINDRQITMFHILANGVFVDSVEPYFDNSASPPVMKEFYYLDINISNQYIGSDVYFQVVGVKEGKRIDGSMNDYVVAWSQITPTIRFKPLPVTDSDTHGWLSAIYDLLTELKTMLEGKLDKLTKAVEDIYTPSPEAEAKFNQSLENLQQKMPFEQMTEQMDNVTNSLNDSLTKLNDPNSTQIIIGGRFRWIQELPESEVALFDLTEYKDFIRTFRTLLAAMFWVYFFHAILNKFTPRTQI